MKPTNSTQIYLLRHGECYASTPEHYDHEKRTMNPPLTPHGIEQAHLLAQRLQGIQFDQIISSDLDRAIHTAQILHQTLQCPFTQDPAFREIDMGEIFLRPWSHFPQEYGAWSLHLEDVPYPGGENGEAVWQRCACALKPLLTAHAQRIAIVCHGGTIRSIVCGALGISQQKRFFFGRPTQNCSITILHHENGAFALHTFNDHAHLSIKPPHTFC